MTHLVGPGAKPRTNSEFLHKKQSEARLRAVSEKRGNIYIMKKPLFYIAIAVAIICIALGIYYLIPGIYHFVGYSNHRSITMTAHRLYAAVFFLIACIGLAIAFFTGLKQSKKA